MLIDRRLRVKRILTAVALAVALAVSAASADAHHEPTRMTRTQWVNAVLRHTNGVTRAEARRIWRRPELRRSMPIAGHTFQHGERWANPAFRRGAVGGCHVSTTHWEYGYGIRMAGGIPVPAREPLFRYTLHRTWNHDGWRVRPVQEWDTDFLAPFADLRWNFDGAFDIENFYLQVGDSPLATHMHSRKGRFSSIVQLGAGRTDIPRSILAKWHGGWETPGHSAHFCTDD